MLAGILTETESGYEFRYNKEYLENKDSERDPRRSHSDAPELPAARESPVRQP